MRSRTESKRTLLGRWSRQELDRMLGTAGSITGVGSRIEFVSRQFLGIPYMESTLTGDANTPELFTINLEAVDCFTYLDYVEAMRLSNSYTGFKENLRKIRYRSGRVAYTHRNHFFTDWRVGNPSVVDITRRVGGNKTRVARKRLNEATDGAYYLPGIPVTKRDVAYIPAALIDSAVIASLQTGDYAGIYTETSGLDVSHVGIIIINDDAAHLRHASSAASQRKVIDQDFTAYIAGKPGILVLRPRD